MTRKKNLRWFDEKKNLLWFDEIKTATFWHNRNYPGPFLHFCQHKHLSPSTTYFSKIFSLFWFETFWLSVVTQSLTYLKNTVHYTYKFNVDFVTLFWLSWAKSFINIKNIYKNFTNFILKTPFLWTSHVRHCTAKQPKEKNWEQSKM